MKKDDTARALRDDGADPGPALRPAPPARGALPAPAPDGHIERRRVLPPAALSPFVHHFWSVRWELRTPFTGEALAHPATRLLLHEKDGEHHAEVAGVPTGRFTVRLQGRGGVFGIAFRPAMFQPLWRASMASLTDRAVPVERALGPDARAWARALHDEPELEGRIAIASAFLAPRLMPVQPELARLRDLVARMAADRSLLRGADGAAAIGRDVRTLERRFRRYVGVTPKWVLQRYRLHEAAEQLGGPRSPALASLAASLGYADQAHFTRDFKRMVGRTPQSFARGRS